MLPSTPRTDQHRGVSPVIGVVLLVGITVILAAVIGVFVLGLDASSSGPANAGVTMSEQPDGIHVTYTGSGTAETIEIRVSGSTITTWNKSDVGASVRVVGVSGDEQIAVVGVSEAGSETAMTSHTVENDAGYQATNPPEAVPLGGTGAGGGAAPMSVLDDFEDGPNAEWSGDYVYKTNGAGAYEGSGSIDVGGVGPDWRVASHGLSEAPDQLTIHYYSAYGYGGGDVTLDAPDGSVLAGVRMVGSARDLYAFDQSGYEHGDDAYAENSPEVSSVGASLQSGYWYNITFQNVDFAAGEYRIVITDTSDGSTVVETTVTTDGDLTTAARFTVSNSDAVATLDTIKVTE
jgi:flagellin-like protein